MFAPPSSPGFARKKFGDRPAAAALARRSGVPNSPEVELSDAGVYGFGLFRLSGLVKLVLDQSVPVYAPVFDASVRPVKCAR
jgi:hypothetical protein